MKRIAILFLLLSLKAFSQEEPFWEYLKAPPTGRPNQIKTFDGMVFLGSSNGLHIYDKKNTYWQQLVFMDVKYFDITSDSIVFMVNPDKLLTYDLKTGKQEELENPYPDDKIANICISPDNEILLLIKIDYFFYKILISKDLGKSWNLYESYTDNEFGYFLYQYEFNTDGKFVISEVIYKNSTRTELIIQNKYQDTIFGEWKEINFYNYDIGFYYFYHDINISFNNYKYFLKNNTDSSIVEKKFLHRILNMEVDNDIIYFFTDNGIYTSLDTCNSFQKISDKYIWDATPLDDSTWYAYDTYDILCSTNCGKEWEIVKDGFTCAEIEKIYIDKNENIYALSSNSCIFKSSDNGETWEEIKFFRGKYPKAILVSDDGKIFVGTYQEAGFFISSDNGLTWEDISPNMTDTDFIDEIFETSKGTIFTNTEFSGINRSTDNGSTWNHILTSDTYHSFYEFDNGNIVAGGTWGKIYLSTDDGLTWEKRFSTSGGSDGWEVNGFVYNRFTNEAFSTGSALTKVSMDKGRIWHVLYYDNRYEFGGGLAVDSIGTMYSRGGTVHKTTDGGKHWELADSGLPEHVYIDMEVSPNGYIFLGTDNGGLYRSRERYVSVKEDKPKAEVAIYSVPNPSSGSTEIHYTCTVAGEVNISIRDILGREYASFNAGYKQPGSHSQHFDTSGLPPGIYFILIESAGSRSVGKMIVEH